MEARYTFRKTQLLDECQVAPEIFEQVIPRLYTLMEPFVTIFHGQVDAQHAKTYVCGLLSDVERKNIESIAYRFGQSRLPLQGFMGSHAWDDEPLRQELRRQVKTHLGQGDGVLVFDPSGFPKSGGESVGVARQWCGRLGKVDNCQVATHGSLIFRAVCENRDRASYRCRQGSPGAPEYAVAHERGASDETVADAPRG